MHAQGCPAYIQWQIQDFPHSFVWMYSAHTHSRGKVLMFEGAQRDGECKVPKLKKKSDIHELRSVSCGRRNLIATQFSKFIIISTVLSQ